MPVTKDRLSALLQKAKTNADQVEIFFTSRKQLKIDVLDQKIESVDDVEEAGLSIRLIKNSRMGFAYTADFDDAALEDALAQASKNAEIAPADENNDLPSPLIQEKAMSLVDADIAAASLIDKKASALEIENAAFAHDKRIKKAEKTSYQDDLVKTILINSKGVDVQYEKAICGAFTEVIAEENGSMETGSWSFFSTRYKDIDPKAIGAEAGRRAAGMLGAGQEKSGRAPVILTPFVGSTILSMLSPSLSSEYAQKGKSLFASATGKPVASKIFTLVDSGILSNGLSTVPYDDEGVPTKETLIISDGTFKGYLYNSYSAKKGRTSSTGNAFRPSFKSQPDITPTNLFVRAGHKTQNELISGISKGFIIETIMGAHTINPVSGDFSIGFSGYFIENGKISRPVRGMTIAGNLLDLLNRIEDIGSDLMFFPQNGNIGTPSMLITNLSVSGR